MVEYIAPASASEINGTAEFDAEFAAFCAQHNQSLPLTKESLAQLPREIELEFYRRMPWENFFELIHSTFAEDPLVVRREVEHGVWQDVS